LAISTMAPERGRLARTGCADFAKVRPCGSPGVRVMSRFDRTEVHMKIILAALGVAALLIPQSALAFGALAVGVPADVAKDGFAYGINVDAPTEEVARA